MKKLLNDAQVAFQDSLAGFAAAHADVVRVNHTPRYVARADSPRAAKVAIVSGGGSGHEPMHIGFVGSGMLDAACPGEVFSAPTPYQIAETARAVDGGQGVLFIVKNFAGDVMNFEMASEILQMPTEMVLSTDDVSGAPEHVPGRGVAGTVVLEKLVGAAAERGFDLPACHALGTRINAATGSLGVALTSCTVPASGTPTFELGEGEMEFGVGIHGERGRERLPMQPAEDIAEHMVQSIVSAVGISRQDRVLLLVNGMGATPPMELYLMYGCARRRCRDRGIEVTRSLVGNYCTSLDMAGCSITLTVLDAQGEQLWDQPVCTPALRWG